MHLKTACIIAWALATALSAKTVKVTDFKPDPKDATAALQAAFDSKADIVIVDNPGFEYLSMPLTLHGNQEIVIQDGVVVRAMPNQYFGLNDTLMTAVSADNLVIRGEGNATLRMNKKDYQDFTRYKHSEWRHCITLRKCRNAAIRDLRIESSGGDGIYLGAPTSKGVLIENLVLADHHRQGISVITAEDVVIRKCKIFGTQGTAPEAGIDFEPNRNEEPIVNNVVEDCDIYGNHGFGIDYALPYNSIKPVSIIIRNTRIYDNRLGEHRINVSGDKTGPLKGAIDIVNCQMNTTSGVPLEFVSPRENGTAITFRDCVFDATKAPGAAMLFCSRYVDDVTGVDFGNTVMLFDPAKEVVHISSLGIARFVSPKGKLTLRHNGKDTVYDFSPLEKQYPGKPQFKGFQPQALDMTGLVPATAALDDGKPIQVRGNATFLQYAEPGRTVRLTCKVGWARTPGGEMELAVCDVAGKSVAQGKVPCPEGVFAFSVKTAGAYKITMNTFGRGAFVTSDAPGFAYCATEESGLHSFRSNHDMYFEVPAELTEVRLEFATDLGEGMRVQVSDENGKVLETTPKFEVLNYLTFKRKPTAKPVMWRIRQFQVVEDNAVRLGAPIKPIVYTSPNNCLVRK